MRQIDRESEESVTVPNGASEGKIFLPLPPAAIATSDERRNITPMSEPDYICTSAKNCIISSSDRNEIRR